ncbi:MAG: MurR/RpiR family transcriptional regulator [Cryobacterium sp.]|nr:MurR/RpiR family transcriptional regulator [Cryobacterium sp.]
MLTVAEKVRGAMSDLHRAERAVARILLADYPVAGLQTVAKLAAQAGVSGPTVLRLTERLGFGSYSAFQQSLRDELQQRMQSPLDQYDLVTTSDDALGRAERTFAQVISRTFALLDPKEFEQAVDLLVSPRRRIFATGGRFTSLIARSLTLHLEILRPGVQFLGVEDRTSMLTDFTSRDVLFVADLRRYQASTITFGTEAARRGVHLILLTDRWLSPLASEAEVVLQVALDAPSPFDSLVGASAAVEALLGGVVDKLGDAPKQRMKDYDTAWRARDFPEPGRAGEQEEDGDEQK